MAKFYIHTYKHVKQVKYVKFLGLLLDENLTWKYHLNELSNKLAGTSGLFFKIRHLLPSIVLNLLACTIPCLVHLFSMGLLCGV